MARLGIVDPAAAEGRTKELLAAAERKLGRVPNILKGMANSPAALQAYLGLSQALAGASLPATVREQVALAVGEENGCRYCVAAHTALGKGAGLKEAEILAARRGTAPDPRGRAAVELALRIVRTRGDVGEGDVAGARKAGLTDGEIAEVVALVALNVYTNWFNHLNDTESDFPPVPPI